MPSDWCGHEELVDQLLLMDVCGVGAGHLVDGDVTVDTVHTVRASRGPAEIGIARVLSTW